MLTLCFHSYHELQKEVFVDRWIWVLGTRSKGIEDIPRIVL